MATTCKYASATTTACCMTTEMNALAAGSNATGSALDNSASQYLYGDFELYCGHSASLGSGGYVSMYFLVALDGTNYIDGSASVDPSATALVANFPLRAIASGCQRITATGITLPNQLFQPLLDNQAGSAATLAATGNILRYKLYGVQSV